MSITLPTEALLRPLPAGSVRLSDSDAGQFLLSSGLSVAESEGRWTDGPDASLTFLAPQSVGQNLVVMIEAGAFIWREVLPEQAVKVIANGREVASWKISDGYPRTRPIYLDAQIVDTKKVINIRFQLPNCRSPASLHINSDPRRLGIFLRRLAWRAVPDRPSAQSMIWQLGRPVGIEARKSYDQKVESGFWDRFITGSRVLDIGFKGGLSEEDVVPITPTAVGVDLDYPGYDGRVLPFQDNSQDAVYSSHCLEHIPGYINAIQEWYRVTKVGGHIITIVPHAHLYERGRRPPSKWNEDHQRFYTPASLLAEFEAALAPNSFRVRYLEENDSGYGYALDPAAHPGGCYEIVLVIEKIRPPAWRLRD